MWSELVRTQDAQSKTKQRKKHKAEKNIYRMGTKSCALEILLEKSTAYKMTALKGEGRDGACLEGRERWPSLSKCNMS